MVFFHHTSLLFSAIATAILSKKALSDEKILISMCKTYLVKMSNEHNAAIMNLREKANLIIYRFRERGLEIFLVNDDENWEIPNGNLKSEVPQDLIAEDKLIELDAVKKDNGEQEEAWAVEGEWHEIPSLKGMLYEDAMELKEKLKSMDNGAFFVVKEAIKKVLPHQYAFLKELKETLIERNSTKNM